MWWQQRKGMMQTTELQLGGLRMGPVSVDWRRPVVLLVLAAVAIGLCWISPDPNTASQPGVRMVLPDFFMGMIGEPQEISMAEKVILPSDTEIVRRVYHSVKGDRIMASIVLAGGEKRSIHRPEVCLPGQGWTIRGAQVVPVQLADGRAIDVMKLMLEREVEIAPNQRKKIRSIYMYWFVGKGVVTPHHRVRHFLTSWDRVVKQLNHRWAYVIVTSLVTEGLQRNGKSEEQTLEMLKQFTAEIAPEFMLEHEEKSE